MPQNDDIRFISSSIKIPLPSKPKPSTSPFKTLHSHFTNATNSFSHLIHSFTTHSTQLTRSVLQKSHSLCSASLSLTAPNRSPSLSSAEETQLKTRQNEERVLISEVLVRNKDGEELERKDLEAEAAQALKACRPNSALTVREVQDDVHRIINSGYFCSCVPVAVDTRDGIRLVFQVEPNQEFQGLVCEGANVIPAKFLENSFRNGYGKVINLRRLDEAISSINDWYMERGLFAMVSAVEILSGGILRLQVSEAEVNNISIRFLDRKTGETTVGKTKPETILRQITTKKGQVYSMHQGKRDVETVLTMGIMEDVSIIPQPADTGKVDLVMNVVERPSGGFSAGGGISSGITSHRGTPDIFESGVHTFVRRAVVIGNGFAASENQSIGLVRALGFTDNYFLYRVTRPKGGVNEWLHWLPVSLHKKIYYIVTAVCDYSQILLKSQQKKLVPSVNGERAGLLGVLEADAKQIVNFARETYEKEGPLLVVACGRDTISTASSIKSLASENVFVVQIQHPRLHLNRFDMVITPKHDYYPLTPQGQEQVPRFLRSWITPRDPPDSHVVLTTGALHQIDFTSIRSAAATWHDEFASVSRPLLVVNIGGPTSNCRYGGDLAKQLVASLLSVLASCGSVRISFTEKTPQKVAKIIVKELGNNPKVYIWDGQGRNPHMGHLAWADAFVVTADSVSMISEACSTGKPVYVVGAERCKWKYTEFHRSLTDLGVVRSFTGSEDISESWSYPPLNDTADAAKRIREALAARGWKLKI